MAFYPFTHINFSPFQYTCSTVETTLSSWAPYSSRSPPNFSSINKENKRKHWGPPSLTSTPKLYCLQCGLPGKGILGGGQFCSNYQHLIHSCQRHIHKKGSLQHFLVIPKRENRLNVCQKAYD